MDLILIVISALLMIVGRFYALKWDCFNGSRQIVDQDKWSLKNAIFFIWI